MSKKNISSAATKAPTLRIVRQPKLRLVEGDWWPEGKSVQAYDLGGHWNGWAEPLVTEATLDAIVAVDEERRKEDGDNSGFFKRDGKFFADTGDDEPTEVVATHQLADGTALYDISLGFCWTWVD